MEARAPMFLMVPYLLLLLCGMTAGEPVDRRSNIQEGERRILQDGTTEAPVVAGGNAVVLVSGNQSWKEPTESRRVSVSSEAGLKTVPIPVTTKKCPPAPAEFSLRKNFEPNAEAEILKTLEDTTLSAIASECQDTPFCVAFDTLGNLWTGLKRDKLVKAASQNPCYGIYFANSPKNWLGLGSAFEPTLRAAREHGAEYVQQQNDFLEQVETVRAVLHQPEHTNMSEAETFTLVTEVLAFTNDLHRRRQLLQATNQTDTTAAVSKLIRAASAPAVWDPRNPATTDGISYQCPVVSQGRCGSCQAFSAVGAAEMAVGFARKQKCPVALSQQWMFFCNGLYRPDCDEGWRPTEAAEVLKRQGVRSASCFPYTGSFSCSSRCSDATGGALPGKFAISLFGPSQIDAAKQFLREKGAIYSFLDVYSDFESYRGGVYQARSGSYQGGHSMVVEGYDDNQRAWIVRNSWGKSWGAQGYVLLSYNDPVFMKGSYYNVVGVSYSESGLTPAASPPPPATRPSPPPSTRPSPPPSTRRPPPPANRSPSTTTRQSPPPPPTNTGSIQCSVTLYSNERFSGLGLTLAWSRPLTMTQAGCAYMGDFSRTSPSFAYLSASMRIQCTCSATNTASACWNLARNVRVFGYTQSFTYYKAAGITNPPYSYNTFMQSDCTASGCSYSETPLARDWYRKLNAGAICFRMDAFGPSFV